MGIGLPELVILAVIIGLPIFVLATIAFIFNSGYKVTIERREKSKKADTV